MKNINFKLLKNIRIIILPIFVLLWSFLFGINFIKILFISKSFVYTLNFFSLIYILYCFSLFLLEDIKYFEINDKNNFENIIYSIDNKIIFYGYLLSLVTSNYYYMSSFSLIIILFLDFIISSKEALSNIKLDNYNRLLNYLFYSILIISSVIPSIFLIGQIIINIIVLVIILLKILVLVVK